MGRSHVAHLNGIPIFYERSGAGRPLVMVHGNGEDHGIFREAEALLRQSFDCILVDSRGHGRSGRVPELHYTDMAEDMLALLERLELRNVLFYGFSDGGIVGLLTASQTDRIGTLVVSGANLRPEGVKPGLLAQLRLRQLLRPDPLAALMLREPDIRDEQLRAIRCETLVLAGSRDLIRESETRHIANTIPEAKLRILEGEDHGSYIVHSETIARILLEYSF